MTADVLGQADASSLPSGTSVEVQLGWVSFPGEVIVLAVRWYLRYGLSYRDVEELLAERGIEVDQVTVFGWVQRCTPLLIDAARPGLHTPGDRWFADETYAKIAGRWGLPVPGDLTNRDQRSRLPGFAQRNSPLRHASI